MIARTMTQILILATIAIWIIYDVVIYIHSGTPATESATLARWAYYYPGLSFLAGVLCGHLFFNIRGPMDWPKDHDK